MKERKEEYKKGEIKDEVHRSSIFNKEYYEFRDGRVCRKKQISNKEREIKIANKE